MIAEVFASVVPVTVAFASPLFLPVVFTSPAKFVTEARVKPVTANCEGPWARARVYGKPVCVSGENVSAVRVTETGLQETCALENRRATSRVLVTPISEFGTAVTPSPVFSGTSGVDTEFSLTLNNLNYRG